MYKHYFLLPIETINAIEVDPELFLDFHYETYELVEGLTDFNEINNQIVGNALLFGMENLSLEDGYIAQAIFSRYIAFIHALPILLKVLSIEDDDKFMNFLVKAAAKAELTQRPQGRSAKPYAPKFDKAKIINLALELHENHRSSVYLS
jgi:hypothetical protein